MIKRELTTLKPTPVAEKTVQLTKVNGQWFLDIEPRTKAQVILHINVPLSSQITFRLGRQAEVELVELWDDTYENVTLKQHVHLEDGAQLTHHIMVLEGNGQLRIERRVDVQRDGQYQGIYSDFGNLIHQQSVAIYLNEEGAHAYWRVAAVASKDDQKDLKIDIYNQVPHTHADMDNYGIVSSNGRITFVGSGHIAKDARLSTTHQTSKIVIFDPQSVAISEPNLYIDENDVEASHASGIGKIDDEQLFYLCSRGIPMAQARRQITLGYLVPVLNYLKDEDMQKRLMDRMERKLVNYV